MLHIAKLQAFRGDFQAELASLHIAPGQCVALCGVSGSGKSTLLEAIGLLTNNFKVQSFKFGNLDVAKLDDTQQQIMRVAKMGIMPQVGGLLPFLTVAENWQTQIKLALKQDLSLLPTMQISTKQKIGKVANRAAKAKPRASETNNVIVLDKCSESQLYERLLPLADRLGLEGCLNKLPEQLSIGQRQRALFLRAIAHGPKLLLIDEPTSSLDPDNAGVLFNLIEEIAQTSKMGVLIVTHDLKSVARYNQYIYQPEQSHSGYAFFDLKKNV